MTGFGGALAVARVHVAHTAEPFVTVPLPAIRATERADELITRLYNLGESHTLFDFDRGDSTACWIRARDVVAVDVIATEDPGA